MMGDPYEEADQQARVSDAKVIAPSPAPKSRKVVAAGMVLASVVLGVVILANIAGYVSSRVPADAHPAPKPTTMTAQQSDGFARQQSNEAAYLKGMDRDKQQRNAEDTVLGQSGGLAGDAYAEVDGVPKKTQAQDDAEHGRAVNGGQPGEKSGAEQQRERAALEEQHRRQNDLDSSPVAIDFSDYFEREKEPGPAPVASAVASNAATNNIAPPPRNTPAAANGRPAHDPSVDYTFDSSFGKLYRLMEDTIVETVLVNRLTGASVGPVITMVTTDVYSENSAHLLIPKGTRLLGTVSAVASLNQERLFVAFHRMIMPDGYSVSLDRFQGLDVVGQTGLRDLVNHHYIEIFGTSLALAAIGAGAQVGNNGGAYGSYNWGVSMRSGVSQGLSESAQRVMERFLNVLPTFTIRERARVKVMLTGDLLLPDTKNHSMDPDL